MRDVKAKDYWSKLPNLCIQNYCSSVNLFGLNGFNNIDISSKMQIICGLNGVGKTTVLSCVKDILGIELTEQDMNIIGENKVTGKIMFGGALYNCQNEPGKRLINQVDCANQICYYDYFSILRILDFLWKQKNFNELLEQNELANFEGKELDDINYLIGKSYQSVTITLIEDIEELGSIPFFEVSDNGEKYDTRKMGIGEYSLLYLYWKIHTNQNSIMLIEEPESFIAVESQMKLMNIICERIVKGKNSFIISTHSPFIIKNVNEEYIKIISKVLGYTTVNLPNNNKASSILGFAEELQGVLYVEDEMAKDFLEILLARENMTCRNRFEVQKAGGSGEISQILKLSMLKNMKYSIIGIYDEDQKGDIPNEVCLPYLILPPTKDIETSIIALLKTKDNLEEISSILRLNKEALIEVFSRIQGLDRHDWICAFLKEIGLEQKQLLIMLYDMWRKDNECYVERFINELRNMTN